MTMNYRRKNKRNYKKIVLLSLCIILFIFILSILSKPLRNVFADIAGGVAYPFWKSKIYIENKFSILTALINSRESLVKTNIELREELLHRRAKSFDLDLLEEENKTFRAILERTEATSTIPAFILARPPLTSYDVFIVDVGRNANIEIENKVFFENILLGEVVQVLAQTSKIRLFSSGGIETQAFLGSQKLPIKMIGRGGGNLVGSVSQEVKVEIGDEITISGERSKILGKVEEVEHGPASSFKKIYVRLPVNLAELRWVSIEK
ncbi:MAG: rod shape-determining protein MreC [Patescibacteria group bacterium]